MKFLIICLAVASVAAAAVPPTRSPYNWGQYYNRWAQPYRYWRNYEHTAPVLKSKSNLGGDGSYSYEYQTANGIRAHQQGVGGRHAVGSNSYTSPEGIVVRTSYVADETGYHPTGSHIPTPPPIPPAILRSLAYIARKDAQARSWKPNSGQYNPYAYGKYDDGKYYEGKYDNGQYNRFAAYHH